MFHRLLAPFAGMKSRAAIAGVALLAASGLLHAETVDVKYRGPVHLAKFQCTGELDSSVLKRVCYNPEYSYMLIRLKQTWYHYCEIDQGTVDALFAAESKGRFYDSSIKDSGTGGKFGCRDKPVPEF
ncbi:MULTISPECIES: KTSC domain-containing protein [unclassified Mesorhizobium]|uniref:KTSC domain-containing protein n=1 Tax=unclassified Mesorhizobium TaxID=325217 RepID=UPI001AEDF9DD|nr:MULTISPECIES: KTSC domain-containing protein [unclassified Mesorhizobium]